MHVLKDYVDPSIPATRDSGVVIPGRHGEIDFGAYLGNREFSFPIVLIPQSSYYEALAKTDELKKILLDPYGRPRTFELVVGDRPDRFYNARYSGSLPISDLVKNRFFTLPLTAYDPHAYSIVTNDDITWGSQNVTFESMAYTYGHTGGGQAEKITSPKTYIVCVSGLAQRPIITINGSGSDVIIYANGKSFSLGTFNNTNWLIDGNTWTVLKNGVNGLSDYNKNYPNGSWLEFIPGDNPISINGTSLNLTIQVKFRDKFI